MAEYIDRQAALEECDWYANEFCECEYAIMPLKGALENLPAADVRPVVLCKDCKHSDPWYSDKSRCFLWHEDGIDVFNDGFCNYGEKREES